MRIPTSMRKTRQDKTRQDKARQDKASALSCLVFLTLLSSYMSCIRIHVRPFELSSLTPIQTLTLTRTLILPGQKRGRNPKKWPVF
jgi:hypothetical protein